MRELADEPACTVKLVTPLLDGQVREIEFETIAESTELEATSTSDEQFGGAIKGRNQMMSTREKKAKSMFDDQFGFLFYKIAGEDERIDSFELQKVMAMIFRSEFPATSDFSLEACRAMIASMDSHREGKLNYSQFKDLWKRIMKWKYTFDASERDHDGRINYTELCIALRKLGFKLCDATIQCLMNRFQNKRGVIELDDFIQICSKTRAARRSYETRIKQGNASLDTFLLEIIYN